jgi:hypothetical protein
MFKYTTRNIDEEYYYGYHRYTSYSDKLIILEPLITHLKKVDQHRFDLYNKSISLNKLRAYKSLLAEPVALSAGCDSVQFSLLEHTKFERLVSSLGLWDIQLQVRRCKFTFPKYLICEIADNYDSGYGLVLAEYYKSFDYEIEDERFVRLMIGGHEKYFIRMEPFKEKLSADSIHPLTQIENILKAAGDYLQIAWHDDQTVSFLIADHLKIQVLKEAIEILYLILGADLSSLRSNYTPEMKSFFSNIFPRKSIGLMLEKTEKITAKEFQNMEEKARFWYSELNHCFASFLSTKIEFKGCRMPAYKLIFANIFRLNLVSNAILRNPEIKVAIKTIKSTSYAALKDLLSNKKNNIETEEKGVVTDEFNKDRDQGDS